HGVLNTDNMNVTGESFDYGPWRWLPQWDPGFTAAYFDHQCLYAFGRQPEAIRWNLGQLAVALRPLAEVEPLLAALDRFGPLYGAAMTRRFCWRLGVAGQGLERDAQVIEAAERTMRAKGIGPDAFFYRHRGGRAAQGDLGQALAGYQPLDSEHDYWRDGLPETMLIDEVETLWSAIDQRDDWAPLMDKVARLRRMGSALGNPPSPYGINPIA
ncbi:MAG: YdiU family protein, partial [Erythrobacter sp.]|nr:YdiU family protein [Erythrobacter sp.]